VRVAPPERRHEAGEPIPGRAGGATIFMNRGGGHYTGSWWDDATANESSILQFGVDMPEFPYGDRSWDQVMACMRELYAAFDVVVTDVDPGDTPHVEVIASGSPQDIGQSEGVAGIAPMACEPIDNAIVYAFAEVHGDDPVSICETAGQESAHAFGLDHELLCEDIQTYLWGCGRKSFVDQDAPCGEYQERGCACGGDTQNSYQYLMSVLGPSEGVNQPPSVAITSPIDGAEVAPGFAVEVEVSDDGAIAEVALWIDGEQVDTADGAPWTTHAPDDLAPGSVEVEVRVTDDGAARTSDTIGVDVGPIDPGDEPADPIDPIVPGAVGSTCEEAADCDSNACVLDGGYCTDLCEGAECPEGFECSETPSGSYCLENTPRERGGCAVATGSTSGLGLALFGIGAMIGLVARRRRR
jgi:MYXO-CTERM domain-containing protein